VTARAINLARQGYVVLAVDMVGYNDSIQTPHDFGEKPVEQLWGFGSFGLQLWNAIRAIDFLESLPGVNPHQIGATGASGGATRRTRSPPSTTACSFPPPPTWSLS